MHTENFSRHNKVLRHRRLTKDTKMWIPDKKNWAKTLSIFSGTWSILALMHLSADHSNQISHENLKRTSNAIG